VRVVFMGTPEFAVPALRALAERHDVAAVLTRPDAVSGRGAHTRPSLVSVAACELRLPVRHPAALGDPGVLRQLRDTVPDVIVVAAYGLILPREVLDIPPHGCVNIHASLLPRWRGAAPIHRAVLAGDAETGVSIMRMEEGLDTGPYCVVRRTAVADKTVGELTVELAELGADAVIEALERIASGTCAWVEQDESLATYADKVLKSEVALDPGLSTTHVLRRVRASTGQAPARTRIAGRDVTVVSARAADLSIPTGSVLAEASGLVLGCIDGAVEALRVKPSGKGEMSAADWARGLRLEGAERWEAPA